MGMLTTVCVIMSVIFLAVVLLSNPNQENKKLLTALLIFQVLILILDFIW